MTLFTKEELPKENVEKLSVDGQMAFPCERPGPWSFHEPVHLGDFTSVVYQGKQFLLHIHPGFRADGEMIQTFSHTQVGKDRLDDGQTPGIDLPAPYRFRPDHSQVATRIPSTFDKARWLFFVRLVDKTKRPETERFAFDKP